MLENTKHLCRGIPYLVYLPDGKMGVARTFCADKPWAVARIEKKASRWYVLHISNSGHCRSQTQLVATAERITDEEAVRFCRLDMIKIWAPTD